MSEQMHCALESWSVGIVHLVSFYLTRVRSVLSPVSTFYSGTEGLLFQLPIVTVSPDMLNRDILAEYSSHLVNQVTLFDQEDTTADSELAQRLGLYRVFVKLYEYHRTLLNEILDLENVESRSLSHPTTPYIQGLIRGEQAHLTTNLCQGATQALYHPQNVWVIGRDRNAAIHLQDNRLSRRHAAIQYVADEGFYLIDLESTNGSFVNGEPVQGAVLLKDGDRIRLGSLAFTFFFCRTSQILEGVSPDLLSYITQTRLSQPIVTDPPTQNTLTQP